MSQIRYTNMFLQMNNERTALILNESKMQGELKLSLGVELQNISIGTFVTGTT